MVLIALVLKVTNKIGIGKYWRVVACIILLLAPFLDIFITKGIMLNFKIIHSPLQQIFRTIEKPESVLWLDNIWPGFDEYGRRWMVSNYLDGVHLRMLALNDGRGKLYLYDASPEDYMESNKMRPGVEEAEKVLKQISDQIHHGKKEKMDVEELRVKYEQLDEALTLKRNTYEQVQKDEIDRVMARVKVYLLAGDALPVDLPSISYQVQIRRIPLPKWQDNFVWCDEIDIFDNKKKEIIAFSKRCLGYSPKAGVNPVGDPFHGGARLGDERVFEFDDKVLFNYAGVRSSFDYDRSNLGNRN